METDGTGADDEQVAALTDELEKAQNQQKEAFLTVVQVHSVKKNPANVYPHRSCLFLISALRKSAR